MLHFSIHRLTVIVFFILAYLMKKEAITLVTSLMRNKLFAKSLPADVHESHTEVDRITTQMGDDHLLLGKLINPHPYGNKLGYVAIVVVTYHNIELLKETIDGITQQSYPYYRIYIIDIGGSSSTNKYINHLINQNYNLAYYQLSKDLGRAGAFHYGIERVEIDGYPFIWCMEAGMIPQRYSLWELWKTINISKDKICLQSNCISRTKTHKLTEAYYEQRFAFLKSFTYRGLLISREFVGEIGLPNKELFDTFDEMEYSLRAINSGYRIIQVNSSLLSYHNDTEFIYPFNSTGKYKLPKASKEKWYYYMRNGIIVFPKNNHENLRFRRNHLHLLFSILLCYPKCFPAALCGYLDGKKGVTGKSKKY
jgi:GT2 family glycosyltransferase